MRRHLPSRTLQKARHGPPLARQARSNPRSHALERGGVDSARFAPQDKAEQLMGAGRMADDDVYAEKIRHRAEKWAEGVAALSVVAGMRTCAAALQALDKTVDPLLAAALFSGVVVNYARSFEEAREERTGITRRFSTKKMPPPFDRGLHEALLSLRDEQVAHAGHVLNDYSLSFITVNITAEEAGSGEPKTRTFRQPVGTRARASIACGPSREVSGLALVAHVNALATEASRRLGHAIVEHDLASLFRLEQEQAEGVSYSRTLKSGRFEPKVPGIARIGEEDLVFSRAGAPAALPLGFVVQHFLMKEVGDTLALEVLTSVEEGISRDHS